MIKDFMTKIKDTKNLAKEKNVANWYNCVFQSVIIIIGGSMGLSLFTMFLYADVNGSTPIGELPYAAAFLPIVYSLIISYIALEKLIIIHIHIYSKMNNLIFKGIQKLDMYWFRKYRKHSPLTEGMFKITSKLHKHGSKLTKTRRIVLTILLIAFVLSLQIFWRIPMIIDSIEEKELPVVETETEYQEPVQSEPRPEIIIRGG